MGRDLVQFLPVSPEQRAELERTRMDRFTLAKYEKDPEFKSLEKEAWNLTCSLKDLVAARKVTIAKLRASADYLDGVWFRCNVSKSVGTSTSIIGGGLTIAGGILTILTAGGATPLLIAGLVTSSVGAGTNLGTSLTEKLIQSSEIKDLKAALGHDKDIMSKIESQMENLRRYKNSFPLLVLKFLLEKFIGPDHMLLNIMEGMLSVLDVSKDALPAAGMLTRELTKELSKGGATDVGAVVKNSVGKSVGQNGAKALGGAIVGISAAFLVWDAVDLGFTIRDLVQKKGSKAGQILREKADALENALKNSTN